MFRVFLLIGLLTVACNDAKKNKSIDSGVDNNVTVSKSELKMYHPACGTGDPVAFNCAAGDEEEVWTDDTATLTKVVVGFYA